MVRSMGSRVRSPCGQWATGLVCLSIFCMGLGVPGMAAQVPSVVMGRRPVLLSVLRMIHVGLHPGAVAVDARTRRVFVLNRGPLHDNNVGTRSGFGSVS